MVSKVEIIALEKLNTMHTGTLMRRRLALLKYEESFEATDRVGHEDKPMTKNTGIIEFKATSEWTKAYEELMSILAIRENLPNKQEKKEIRQAKARR
jgi:hypothetical protein